MTRAPRPTGRRLLARGGGRESATSARSPRPAKAVTCEPPCASLSIPSTPKPRTPQPWAKSGQLSLAGREEAACRREASGEESCDDGRARGAEGAAPAAPPCAHAAVADECGGAAREPEGAPADRRRGRRRDHRTLRVPRANAGGAQQGVGEEAACSGRVGGRAHLTSTTSCSRRHASRRTSQSDWRRGATTASTTSYPTSARTSQRPRCSRCRRRRCRRLPRRRSWPSCAPRPSTTRPRRSWRLHDPHPQQLRARPQGPVPPP